MKFKKMFIIPLSILLAIILPFSTFAAQITEPISPYWVHTKKVIIGHTYDAGSALCIIEITGYSGVDSIQNVDVEFSVDIDGEWVEIASWDNLSCTGNTFLFCETIPNVQLGYTYRLSFCADVHRNNTIEWLNDYYDNTY